MFREVRNTLSCSFRGKPVEVLEIYLIEGSRNCCQVDVTPLAWTCAGEKDCAAPTCQLRQYYSLLRQDPDFSTNTSQGEE